MDALEGHDAAAADAVIGGDDEIDGLYMSAQKRALELLALQTPGAADLRLIAAILSINLHLERVGDMAVNIAKITKITKDLPANATIMAHLREMAAVVRPMLRASMDAFAGRDLDLAARLPEMDEPADRLNRGMYREARRAPATRGCSSGRCA